MQINAQLTPLESLPYILALKNLLSFNSPLTHVTRAATREADAQLTNLQTPKPPGELRITYWSAVI